MKAGSAVTLAVLRWLARGAAIASWTVMPRSIRLTSICRTVVMIVEPPGEPSARNGLPSLSTIVGDIELRGRLPGWMRFGSAASYTVEKSVSSLLSRKPWPGTVMPEPPVCSMVSVYSTTLPHRSATVRLVVEMFSVSVSATPFALPGVHAPSYVVTSPAGTGLAAALVGLSEQARSTANLSSRSRLTGTSTKAGSPRYLPRSAKARALASR